MDFFFFKQKTAYDIRISDWSSDVCSSDLRLITCPCLFQDPVMDGAPDYFDRIQQPMDLGTAEERLKRGLYNNAPELAHDIRLTFSNALSYNRPHNPIHDAVMQHALHARLSEQNTANSVADSSLCSGTCGLVHI